MLAGEAEHEALLTVQAKAHQLHNQQLAILVRNLEADLATIKDDHD